MSVNNTPAVNKIYNLIILDESGSMESIKGPTINAFNEIIQSIRNTAKEDTELEQWISFYSFNGRGTREQIPLSRVTELTELNEKTYKPDDNTPLFDAMGYAINKLRYALEGQTQYAVLVTILTDGEENSSKEYSQQAIANLVSLLKTQGWVFTYIGTGHDVQQVAFSLNIESTLQFSGTEESVNEVSQKDIMARKNFSRKVKEMNPKDLNSGYFTEK